MKKLRLFNGRFKNHKHIYIAAYSLADAARILAEAYNKEQGSSYTDSSMTYEILTYFSKDCWGTRMLGIEPKRGAWIQSEYDYNDPPQRII